MFPPKLKTFKVKNFLRTFLLEIVKDIIIILFKSLKFVR